MQMPLLPPLSKTRRCLVWFSCGAASACAAKLAVKKQPHTEVLYCDTLKYEHSDNRRFLRDVENWIGREIKILRSDKYKDIFDVFDKTGWLVGRGVARCSIELKRAVREAYQGVDDVHVFGMTVDELPRIRRFERSNPELYLWWPLVDHSLDKRACFQMIADAGIELPAMYKLGYKNNNCIGCVKGGKGYWNKIRRDFPEAFDRMFAQERKMGTRIFKDAPLSELPFDAGRYEFELSVDCGPACADARVE